MDTATRFSGKRVSKFSISLLPLGQLVHPLPVNSSSNTTRLPAGTKGTIILSCSSQEKMKTGMMNKHNFHKFLIGDIAFRNFIFIFLKISAEIEFKTTECRLQSANT